ncbi:hypothetical protein [Marinomonas transparens]|uniref:Uncharacterized protein n=1 Tax=Marinomonas transparens TaxID=2795388 RepID=A0A934JSB1_9GAMM|nr:hypothetical protein [Marinomonas transparens]MBJ7539099.1 hypothetical protein [Marinomonas transparens]
MIKLNKTLFVSTCLVAAMSTSAIARENRTTLCVHDNQTRIIDIVYSGEGNVPCEVQYTKLGETKTLWSANYKVGYCENKATAFVEKQIGWGWSCDLVAHDEMKEETAQ